MHARATWPLALLCAAALAGPRAARAGNCSALPNPLYLQIGDTQEPLIKYLGKALRDSAVQPMTLVYLTSGSCTNIDAFYNKTPLTVNPKYIPPMTENAAWTPDQATPSCTIDTGGHAIDLANSALFVSACTSAATPADVKLFRGPNQAYTLIAPKQSSQVAITAEEAYFVFGFGAAGQAQPWIDETQVFIRPVTKSTLVSWADNINVPPAKWKGVQKAASTDVLTAVQTSATPEKAIGILGAEIYDANRSTVKVLAFQAYGQHHAFYPDSSDTTFDKQNIRDGHYTVWAPTVWMAHLDANGTPLDARAAYLINLILALDVTPAFDANALDIVIARGLVPDCAMKVTRSVEGGNLSLYQPAQPCGCYYSLKAGGAADTGCNPCTSDATCGAGKCRHGYCEER